MRTFNISFVITSSLFLISCSYGYHSHVSYTPLIRDISALQVDTSHRSADSIELYFNDIKPLRGFVELGYIESIAGQYSTTNELLTAMKKKASEMGAHAVIRIQRNSQTETSGFLFDSKSVEKFQAAVFSGVAVKYLR